MNDSAPVQTGLADGIRELALRGRVEIAFTVHGEPFIQPRGYIAEAGKRQMTDQHMGQFMDNGIASPVQIVL